MEVAAKDLTQVPIGLAILATPPEGQDTLGTVCDNPLKVITYQHHPLSQSSWRLHLQLYSLETHCTAVS